MLTTNEIAYVHIFENYVNRSLDESLAAICMVETNLPLEERTQACHILDYGLHANYSWARSCDLTIALATYMERSGEWEIWQQLLTRAIATAQQLGDAEHEITLTALLARLYQRRGEAAAMVRAYRRVIRLARQHNHRFELARACSNLGYHFIEQGNLWRSELLSYYALAIFTELQSNHGRAHTHNHLGILLTRQYEWAKAEEHLLAACTIWQKSQDQYGLMRGHGNLGFLYNEIEHYEDSIYHSTVALELAESLGEEPLAGNFAASLSFSQLKFGNIQNAKLSMERAETIFTKFSDQLGLARIAHTKGLIAIHEKSYIQAQTYINYALNTLTEYYFLVQVKFTNVELALRLQNYAVAQQELTESEAWITNHLAGRAVQFYWDKLTEYWRCLAQAMTHSQSDKY